MSNRLVDSNIFCESDQGRLDFAAVAVGLDEYNEAVTPELGCMHIWFAKMLCFPRVCLNTLDAEIQGQETVEISKQFHIPD